jgi:hypothetical protein
VRKNGLESTLLTFEAESGKKLQEGIELENSAKRH